MSAARAAQRRAPFTARSPPGSPHDGAPVRDRTTNLVAKAPADT
jgi:hypothetical protein